MTFWSPKVGSHQPPLFQVTWTHHSPSQTKGNLSQHCHKVDNHPLPEITMGADRPQQMWVYIHLLRCRLDNSWSNSRFLFLVCPIYFWDCLLGRPSCCIWIEATTGGILMLAAQPMGETWKCWGPSRFGCKSRKELPYSAKRSWNNSSNFIFPTKYVPPKSFKVGWVRNRLNKLWNRSWIHIGFGERRLLNVRSGSIDLRSCYQKAYQG